MEGRGELLDVKAFYAVSKLWTNDNLTDLVEYKKLTKQKKKIKVPQIGRHVPYNAMFQALHCKVIRSGQ